VGGGGGGGGGGGIAVIGGGDAGAAPPHPPARALILTGFALSELSEAALAEALRVHDEVVFARTSPEQKMRIVAAYQAAGACVAVTGDGTNDAPALRAADVGVAMGSAAASDVAREAADVIVVDDNFVSIVEAIRVGRAAFNNLRKLIAFTVSHAVPELVPVFCLLVFDVPSMLSPLCVLVVDLITEQLPAMYGFGAPPAQEPSARARAQRRAPQKTRTLTHAHPNAPKTPHEPLITQRARHGARGGGPYATRAAQRKHRATGGRAARPVRVRFHRGGGVPALRGRLLPCHGAKGLPHRRGAVQPRVCKAPPTRA
jgi:hypothetical protein